MTGITERVRAIRDRLAQRRGGESEQAQSKVEQARMKAQADERRREHKRTHGGSGGEGTMGGGMGGFG